MSTSHERGNRGTLSPGNTLQVLATGQGKGCITANCNASDPKPQKAVRLCNHIILRIDRGVLWNRLLFPGKNRLGCPNHEYKS